MTWQRRHLLLKPKGQKATSLTLAPTRGGSRLFLHSSSSPLSGHLSSLCSVSFSTSSPPSPKPLRKLPPPPAPLSRRFQCTRARLPPEQRRPEPPGATSTRRFQQTPSVHFNALPLAYSTVRTARDTRDTRDTRSRCSPTASVVGEASGQQPAVSGYVLWGLEGSAWRAGAPTPAPVEGQPQSHKVAEGREVKRRGR